MHSSSRFEQFLLVRDVLLKALDVASDTNFVLNERDAARGPANRIQTGLCKAEAGRRSRSASGLSLRLLQLLL